MINNANEAIRKYSSFNCIGYDGNIPKSDRALCKFDNLCYSLNHSKRTNAEPKGKFLYFENENAPPDYIFNKYGEILFDFEELIIPFKHKYHWKLNTVNSSIPDSSDPSNIYWFKDKAIVMHAPYYPANFGHCLGDDFLATYKVLSHFGLYSAAKSQIMFLYNFDKFWDLKLKEGFKPYWERSNKYYQMINPYLYDSNYTFLTDFEDEMSSKYEYICFETMVIASQKWTRQNHDTFEWSDFLDIFLNKYDIHKQKIKRLYALRKQRILFLCKSQGWHGRSWANENVTQEIINYLSNLFKVQIDIAYDYEFAQMTLFQQINVALDYTVLIAPSGALSYLGAFMAPNTAVVIKDVFEIAAHRSQHLDYWIWNYDHRKNVFYISTNESDARFQLSKEEMKAKGETALIFAYRDAAAFYLDPQKVAYVVYNALNWVEKKLNWEDSFYLPKDWRNYMTLN